jgi:hypothetical protein
MKNDMLIGISNGATMAFAALTVIALLLATVGAFEALTLWSMLVLPVGILALIIRLKTDTPAQ